MGFAWYYANRNPNRGGGGGRPSGGSSVAAGRKAKESYRQKQSKARYKANSSYMPYAAGKRVKGS